MMTPYDPAKAKEIIEEHAARDFAFDFEGNRVGLRRFAIVVEDLEGDFLHFLTMAEAAIPVADGRRAGRENTCLLARFSPALGSDCAARWRWTSARRELCAPPKKRARPSA